jgi:aryl-phospho-beta-D-glucosidase BglC (GH1 family)
MLRVLLLALALTSHCTWPAGAADLDWLCYTGPKEPGGPAIRCLPAGDSVVAHPLAGWRGAPTRGAPRTVDVTNRLGRVSVRVRGAARLFLAPADGGATALACRSARARGAAAHRHTRLVVTDARGEHVVRVGRPKRLCDPTDGSLPQLLCYRIANVARALAVSKERGARQGRSAPQALCLPTTRPTDGPVDPTHPGDPTNPPSTPGDPGDPTVPPSDRPGTGAVDRAPLSTAGAKIVDREGREFVIQGVNWFGFETSNHVPHGLWSRDYRDMLAQIASLGFNTIRLPFSIQSVRAQSFTGVDFSAGRNAALAGKTPIEAMDVIVEEAERQGLLVLLDNHSASDNTFTYGLWYGIDGYTEEDWVETWRALATRYRIRRNVIGADLKNEPHGPATWGTGDPTDWRRAAERAGNAVHAIAPHWLIVVEGVEGPVEGQLLDRHWWGGNLEGVRLFPVRLGRPNELVYSPHEYGPSVFAQPWFSAPNYRELLYDRWAKGFQFIADEGTAPILIGEFGGKDTGTDTVAGVWLRQFMDYLGARGFSWTYWSWNPDSGDTGGVLLDDWQTVDQGKMALLRQLIARESIATR